MDRVGPLRAFVALNVDAAAIDRVAEGVRRLRAHRLAPKARWVSPTKIHVTLKFLGDVDPGLVPLLRDALAAIAAGRSAPSLAFPGLSAFPSVHKARVVVVEIEDTGGRTASLAAEVEDLCERLGLPREARGFHPHLTVARTREPTSVGAWLEAVPFERVVASAPELVLYDSDLSRPGSDYEPLARFALAPDAPG